MQCRGIYPVYNFSCSYLSKRLLIRVLIYISVFISPYELRQTKNVNSIFECIYDLFLCMCMYMCILIHMCIFIIYGYYLMFIFYLFLLIYCFNFPTGVILFIIPVSIYISTDLSCSYFHIALLILYTGSKSNVNTSVFYIRLTYL